MLKAKIKEKLLNRRNDVEVDELLDSSGDNVETKLAQLDNLLSKVDIQENGLQISYYVAAENSEFGDIHVSDGFGGSGNVYLTNLLYLVDEEENPLFPLENNAGKVLAVNEDEDGLVAVDTSSLGGSKIYRHEVTLASSNYIFIIFNNRPTPFDTNTDIGTALRTSGVDYPCIMAHIKNSFIASFAVSSGKILTLNFDAATQAGSVEVCNVFSNTKIVSDTVTIL